MSTETFAYHDTTIWLVVSVLITAVVLASIASMLVVGLVSDNTLIRTVDSHFAGLTVEQTRRGDMRTAPLERRVSVMIGEVPCVARVSDGVLVVICKNNPREQS